jgi:hypothetical protein
MVNDAELSLFRKFLFLIRFRGFLPLKKRKKKMNGE